MNPRRLRLTLVIVVLVLAIAIIALAVLAQFAHSDYGVPLADWLRTYSAGAWKTAGVVAFLVGLALILLVSIKPGLVFQVQELTDRTLKPQLHIRCRHCGVIQRLEDTGERPLRHFCPKCGTTGEYAGPESGEKDFIYTRVEMKLGCSRCHTTFRIPEPLFRPLYTECPNCHATGVLKEKQRAEDAQEVPVACANCGHAFHVYSIKGRWTSRFACPSCGAANPMPAMPA